MADPKIITETTTLAELREQLNLLDVVALRIITFPEGVSATLHHANAVPNVYMGTGTTHAAAIEAACRELRRALRAEPFAQPVKES